MPLLLLWLIITLRVAASNEEGVFNVMNYDAKADAKVDDSKAFLSTWSAACSYSQGESTMLIPEGSYLVGPLTFKGQCAGKVKFQLNGNLLASTNMDDFAPKKSNGTMQNWVEFKYVDGLNITGGGVLDGQGASAWPYNNCTVEKHCTRLPITLVLSFVTSGSVSGISSIDSKFFHMVVYGCKEMTIDSVTIRAPHDSPNTDGIHIGASTVVSVLSSTIGTGDDCISIGPDVTNVTITNVTCGPGHGISVGSLGQGLNDKHVEGLTVTKCTFNRSDNGVRIKTWQTSVSSPIAAHFLFQDMTMINVRNPIIIDQRYCPNSHCNATEPSKVQIKDVKFRDFRGTSSSKAAISLVCSEWYPCQDIELSNIALDYNGPNPDIKNATSICVNAQGTSFGTMNPKSCLTPPQSSSHLPNSHRKYSQRPFCLANSRCLERRRPFCVMPLAASCAAASRVAGAHCLARLPSGGSVNFHSLFLVPVLVPIILVRNNEDD
ncbi:exopolygalacturonase-like [Zingiber officinale]|uniref:exopolygalacturonase-like n=1 Tax=Zingiber officinale TaxID=94328 RepID=UPI001C4C15D7|nr:exopolygalacturonase-like [Zingiber officinale]